MERQQNKRILKSLRIAAPCDADWNEMEGDDRKRFCSLCKKNVYNTQNLTEQAIIDLISQSEDGQPPCMRLYRRKDGTVLTANCPVGLKRVRRKIALAASLVFGMLGMSALAYSLFRTEKHSPLLGVVAQPIHIMGKVAAPTMLMGEVAVHNPDK